jgi:hypothetical protein
MSHHVSNVNIRHRLTQIIVLIIVILACMLFAQFAHAQRSIHKARFDKPKYRATVYKDSDKACYILHKKRTSVPKHPLFAFAKRSKTNKPMAETEPSKSGSAN